MTDTNRNDEKFVVRLKQGQREQVKARAKAEHRTMNDVVTVALARYLEQGDSFDKLLLLLDRSTEGNHVTISAAYLRELYQSAVTGNKLGLDSKALDMVDVLLLHALKP